MPQLESVSAEIHHFYPDPKTGETYRDEHGEPIIGFFWQIKDGEEELSALVGPYASHDEAEEAANKAYSNGTYREM